MRTATHKLIHYWNKDAYEMFDIVNDPTEQKNLLHSMADAQQPEIAAKFAELKAELTRLQKEYKDDGQFADPATWPKTSADGPFGSYQPISLKTVSEAIAATAGK